MLCAERVLYYRSRADFGILAGNRGAGQKPK